MSKTKAIQIPADVQRIEQAWRQAQKVSAELRDALKAARSEEERLANLLQVERVKLDKAGPLATIKHAAESWRVVVDRRTATTIWTRAIGTAPGTDGRRWRKDGRGQWTPYPRTKNSYRADPVLTIDGEQA